MGKGDKRTKKGKRIIGTYGNSRKKKVASPVIAENPKKKATKKEVVAKKESTEEVVEVKKVAAKKPAAKKAATAKKPATKKAAAKETADDNEK